MACPAIFVGVVVGGGGDVVVASRGRGGGSGGRDSGSGDVERQRGKQSDALVIPYTSSRM